MRFMREVWRELRAGNASYILMIFMQSQIGNVEDVWLLFIWTEISKGHLSLVIELCEMSWFILAHRIFILENGEISCTCREMSGRNETENQGKGTLV